MSIHANFKVLRSFVEIKPRSLFFPQMKKTIFNTLKYLAFFAIGLVIFWFLYRKLPFEKLKAALRELNYFFILLSILLSVFSQLSRALRWKLLIRPMGYNPSTTNTFLSVLVLYFVNLIVPRAGEVARCTVLSQTDRVPFVKLIGTVVVERIADFLMLIILAVIIFAANFSVVVQFFNEKLNLQESFQSMMNPSAILIGIGILALIIFGAVYIFKKLMHSRFRDKILEIRNQFVDGIRTIGQMKKKGLFIFHTCLIFFLWLIMLYVVFLAYEPTAHLTLRVGMLAFLMGGLAMLAPVQGGIGPWHWMVIQTLMIYGISEEDGLIFAAVAHTSTNLIYVLIGGIALIYLVLRYGRNKISLTQKDA